jgi:tetratricopeptide (TPR) repeat protein
VSRKTAAALLLVYAVAAAGALSPEFSRYRAKIELERCESALLVAARLDPERQRRLLPAVREALHSVADRLPYDVRPVYLLGTSALLLGEPGEAIEQLRRAIAMEERPEADLNLSRAHAAAGDADAAAQDALRAIWLSPSLHRNLPASAEKATIEQIRQLGRELDSGSGDAIPRLAPSDAAASQDHR